LGAIPRSNTIGVKGYATPQIAVTNSNIILALALVTTGYFPGSTL
jgi:hypothetical protein